MKTVDTPTIHKIKVKESFLLNRLDRVTTEIVFRQITLSRAERAFEEHQRSTARRLKVHGWKIGDGGER